MQVVPEPRAESSLPRLRLVLNGITGSCISALERHQVKPRLPITIDVEENFWCSSFIANFRQAGDPALGNLLSMLL